MKSALVVLWVSAFSLAIGWAQAGLPRPSSSELAPATAAAVAEIEAWMGRLTGPDAAARAKAAAGIESATQTMVPAISRKVADLKKTADRDAMSSVLATAKQGGPAGDAKSWDWLDRLMAAARPQDPAWRDLVAVLALSRMLAHVESTPAVRELIGIYAAFGDLLRVDVERQIQKLGEHAVAALIEARRAESRTLRAWAGKELDILGKTVPGEAVQTSDNQVLSDVLRAYGRTRDSDAARVVVSFANSDRAQVRDAAREAVVMMGENGLWQLRESFESLTGKRPPDDWGWERAASELFALYDKSRLAQVHGFLDEGLAMEKAGRLDDMAKAFDKALARAPMFERRGEMVRGYLALAKSIERSDRTRALALARKAARIDPAGPLSRQAEAEVGFLEAEDLAARGVVDEAAYARAVELDPSNESARAALSRIKDESDLRLAALRRWGAGAAIALAAVIAGVAVLARRRKRPGRA